LENIVDNINSDSDEPNYELSKKKDDSSMNINVIYEELKNNNY